MPPLRPLNFAPVLGNLSPRDAPLANPAAPAASVAADRMSAAPPPTTFSQPQFTYPEASGASFHDTAASFDCTLGGDGMGVSAANQAQELLQPGLYGTQVLAIVEAVENLPVDVRAEFVHIARRLVGKGISSHDYVSAIQLLGSAPWQRWAPIVDIAFRRLNTPSRAVQKLALPLLPSVANQRRGFFRGGGKACTRGRRDTRISVGK